jgi:hypothetical protein
MAKKKETIKVMRYDPEMGDEYEVEVPKLAVDACALCACVGCSEGNCCGHLRYWNEEHGRPARFQIDSLVLHIKKLEEMIKKYQDKHQAISTSIDLAISGMVSRGPRSQSKAFLMILRDATQVDTGPFENVVLRRKYLCDACSCSKCIAFMSGVERERLNIERSPVNECCGHKSTMLDDLPF